MSLSCFVSSGQEVRHKSINRQWQSATSCMHYVDLKILKSNSCTFFLDFQLPSSATESLSQPVDNDEPQEQIILREQEEPQTGN